MVAVATRTMHSQWKRVHGTSQSEYGLLQGSKPCITTFDNIDKSFEWIKNLVIGVWHPSPLGLNSAMASPLRVQGVCRWCNYVYGIQTWHHRWVSGEITGLGHHGLVLKQWKLLWLEAVETIYCVVVPLSQIEVRHPTFASTVTAVWWQISTYQCFSPNHRCKWGVAVF